MQVSLHDTPATWASTHLCRPNLYPAQTHGKGSLTTSATLIVKSMTKANQLKSCLDASRCVQKDLKTAGCSTCDFRRENLSASSLPYC